MKNLIIFSLFLSTMMQAQHLSSLEFDDEITTDEIAISTPKEEIATLKSSYKNLRTKKLRKSQSNKLIKKADEYFDKMWYAEAAELYDIALKKNKQAYTLKTLQRAGDAHYFNTDLDNAYHWYSILFADFEAELNEAHYFRYAHILKGTKRYRRAKRLINVLNKSKEANKLAGPENGFDEVKATIIAKNVELKNLNINTKYSEFSPMYLKDEQLVYASSRDSSFLKTNLYKWNNQPFLDLYVGKVDKDRNEITTVKKLSNTLNSKYHEAGVAFSIDHNTIYFTRNNFGKKLRRSKNGINHLKIYTSNFDGDSWSEPTEVSFNSEDYSTGHPAMSTDGSKLYFVSDRPGGFGETDIYVVDLLSNGAFSEPRNLGPEVNSSKREMFPFITETTLTFSSDRSYGFGGLDIYESTYSNDKFNRPVNIGEPINSRLDDFSYITDNTGLNGYFASNREGGKGDDDIYAFTAIEKQIAEKKSAIVGVIKNSLTGELLPKTQLILTDINDTVLAEVESKEDGSFEFNDIDLENEYKIAAKNQDYLMKTEIIKVGQEKQIEKNILLDNLDGLVVDENGVKKVDLKPIYFGFDKYTIRADEEEELNKLLEVWEKYPNMVVKIESHTDARGPKAYNKMLSDKRAKSTRDYLISKGVDASKIFSAIGYGEEYPINQCEDGVRCSRDKHEENRRSEFIIMSM